MCLVLLGSSSCCIWTALIVVKFTDYAWIQDLNELPKVTESPTQGTTGLVNVKQTVSIGIKTSNRKNKSCDDMIIKTISIMGVVSMSIAVTTGRVIFIHN